LNDLNFSELKKIGSFIKNAHSFWGVATVYVFDSKKTFIAKKSIDF
jgi:hypothetical protein